MSKSGIYVANTGVQSVAIDGAIALGSVVRRFGCGVDLNGTGITIDEPGYYDVNLSVTAEPTAAGPVTVSMINNGVAVSGATATATAAAAGDAVNLSFESMVRVFCNGNIAALTFALTDGAASITNVAVVITKL